LVLFPKIKHPTKVIDFRLFILCNVLYKLVSKVLTHRLKKILPNIISSNQSAYISVKLITNNVITAFETFYTISTYLKGKTGYMALKLDISKTYHRVEWCFMEGLCARWILMISGYN
jgi:hypothetical protein